MCGEGTGTFSKESLWLIKAYVSFVNWWWQLQGEATTATTTKRGIQGSKQ
jgi:hypothetical protein